MRTLATRFRDTCTELVLGTDGALPTEFVIFEPGDNSSTKGPALWDATAAASVMSRVQERGQVDYMIDLEHRSLDPRATALTADAADAMGWFNIEMRGAACWAVNVRWTPEGARRLAAKTQRYTSPAFYWLNDEENGRVGEIINVALVSMPATHDQAALVAAARREPGVVPVSAATRALAALTLKRVELRASCVRTKALKR